MSRPDARMNTYSKPWASIELWNGTQVGGTLLEEHGDGTATIEWDRGPWRGRLLNKKAVHPINEE